jgi:multisubunit Na+/H+ antiporter MnhG subunit
MRWAVLLLFGGFASFLGYLGWIKFNEAKLPLRDNEEAMVLLGACAAGWFLALGGFATLASSSPVRIPPDPHTEPQQYAEWMRERSAGEAEARRFALNPRLDAPIELRNSRASTLTGAFMALVLAGCAIALFRNPDTLWTRWIAYPVGGFVLLYALLLAIDVPFHWRKRYVATNDAMEIHFKGDVTRIPFSDVKAIKDVQVVVHERRPYGQKFRTVKARYLSLRGAAGEELLRLDYDLQPEENVFLLMRYLPARTKLAIEPEQQ